MGENGKIREILRQIWGENGEFCRKMGNLGDFGGGKFEGNLGEFGANWGKISGNLGDFGGI